MQVQLQRIIQEALTNTRKHGQAHCVQVRFERADRRALVTVQDDGLGFDLELQAAGEGGHFGLRFLQERAQEVHGSVTIVSSPAAPGRGPGRGGGAGDAAGARGGASVKVLLVDDHPLFIDGLKNMLNRAGSRLWARRAMAWRR